MAEVSLVMTAISPLNISLTTAGHADMQETESQLNEVETQVLVSSVRHRSFMPQPHGPERSLGLLGIILGCILLMILLAFITCLRLQRKLFKVRQPSEDLLSKIHEI